jgi:dipeptidyl aminopeptidase/acylaminoacyl peptidase
MRPRVTRLLLLTGYWLVASAAPAQPARTHDITVDDYFSLGVVSDVATSPSGTQVAYSEGRWQQTTDDRKADLWIVDPKTQKTKRLTFDRAGDRAPSWSADEKYLYCLGGRKREGEKKPPYDGKTQVWRVAVAGGEPRPVTSVEGGVLAFQLAADGGLYYLTEKDHVEKEWQALREKYADLEYGHGVNKVSVLWRLDLDTWKAEKVVDENRHIHEFSVAPNGRVAMVTTADGKVVSFEGRSQVEVYEPKSREIVRLEDKVWRADAPSPYGWIEKLAWAGDGQALAFNIVFDGYPAEVIVTSWAEGRPRSARLKRPEGQHVRGYGSPLQWTGGEDLWLLLEEKARVRLYRVQGAAGKEPKWEALTTGDVVVEAFHFNPNGSAVAFIQSGPKSFPEIYCHTRGGGTVQATELHKHTETWKLPKLSLVQWKGARGDAVEGILELPPDYKEGKKVPLVVCIHGGPTTADYFGMQFWIYGRTLLPAKGYAVLCPNYRGSTGYGDKFLTDLVGHENDLDVEDILKGVEALMAKGVADPDRLGVMGWSNGGYLTNCVITHTTRFKAASSGAGIVDTVLEWGANDEPAYMLNFAQGLPWTKPDIYRKSSPCYALDKVRTPTLIHVGGADDRCPPANSRMLYRALKEYVHVPTELIVYPGEPHGLSKYKNRKAKMEWDLAWFERYILDRK